jgi:hypothetical protein
MPCRDYYADHPNEYFQNVTEPALKKQVSFAESALCQTLRALEYVDSLVETITPKLGDFYDWIDFEAAGIKKADLLSWHANHKALDKKHRAEEMAKKEKARLKKAALAKLTPDEKIALGLK